jgi:TRAP-type C4-dicarboxylate transport system permease large subunit
VLAPLAEQVGINPLHFAMSFTLTVTIGMVTPPIGAVLMIITAVGRLNFERLCRSIIPMVLTLYVVLLFVIYIPEISLIVPRWFGLTH